jgi:transposase
MDIAVVNAVTKTIGSLALSYPYLRRLGFAQLIDGLTTKGKEREVSTGRVVEVLVLNRLSLRPSPLSKVDAWARGQVIEEVYGVAADAFNDDRIGRALDEIYPHLTDAWAALVLRGAQTYGVALDQLHSDVTRLAFEGAYEPEPGEVVPVKIVHGYTGREDPTRKQVTVSLSVAADGAIPAWYELADGNAADTRAYLAHLKAAQEQLHLDDVLMAGDSKLITRPNMRGFCRAHARFVGPASLTEADRQTLRALWEAGEPWQRLDVSTAGEAAAPGRYWGMETTELLPDPEKETAYLLQRFFIQSLDDQRASRHQRAKDLAKAHAELCAIRHRLSRPAYRDRAMVERKLAAALAKVDRYLHVTLADTPAGFTLTWRLDRAALAEDAQFDGVYCLLTNDTSPEASLHRTFRAYKGQPKVEGRFRAVKSPPIQVRPVWLHQPRRIASLVFVVMVALFVFALIEREARRVVAESQEPLRGVRPDGRDHLPITTPVLCEAFASLTLLTQRLRVGDELHDVVTPTTLTWVQQAILDRLGLDKPDAYLQPVITPHPPEGCGK